MKTHLKTNLKIAGALAGTALFVSTSGAVQAGAMNPSQDPGPKSEAAGGSSRSLTGVWTATVDPLSTPEGNQPPFESTLSYDRANVVNEITSKVTSTSAGLGSWEKVGDSTYRTSWLKYRFDATGAYIGKTVVVEEINVTGTGAYQGRAQTKIIDTSGAVVAQFESEVAAERMAP